MSGEINISVLFRLAAEQARREASAFGGDVKALGAAASDAGQKTAAAGAAIDQTGVAAKDAATSITAATSALAQAVSQEASITAQMGQTATSIAGAQNAVSGLTRSIAPMNNALRGNAQATGAANAANANLFSQWNDIMVMMAAGQNPIQLALQQGTQVCQVLTSLGGGTKALRAVGSSLLAMLNPISLATIGIIAFGSPTFPVRPSSRPRSCNLARIRRRSRKSAPGTPGRFRRRVSPRWVCSPDSLHRLRPFSWQNGSGPRDRDAAERTGQIVPIRRSR